MKDNLIILEQKIKDRMEWYKDQYGFKKGYAVYVYGHNELNKVLGMIEEVRKDD